MRNQGVYLKDVKSQTDETGAMKPGDPPWVVDALRRFDEANAADPNREACAGREWPRELLYARRLTAWVLRLAPDASVALRLAAGCQHLCRWTIPRSGYPADRAGYLRWRLDLKLFHARRAGEILQQTGCPEDIRRRVEALNLKRGLGTDAECGVLEDALCLVFLEFQLAGLAARTDDAKVVQAIRKSWAKMTEGGRAEALRLSFGVRERTLVEQAIRGA